ncbi:MAG TPA: L-erythro-3,5-diaminohexanoate dehydrogenase [Polyangiaceae bacterium]
MRKASSGGDEFGTHRSLEPKGALPQPADRLDNDFSRLFSGEMLVEVETLNVDAASFRQMEGTGRPVAEQVLETVRERGKQHNRVTGSGGMLLGRVLELAPGRPAGEAIAVGDRVASLISLSLTPLRIDEVGAVRAASAQLDVRGEAVLFASSPYAKMPSDFADRVALAALDVAGAAPQVARLVKRDAIVVILGGGGKSGALCACEARRAGGPGAKVIAVESHEPYAREVAELGVCDAVVACDARDPVATRAAVLAKTGREADLVLSCVNVDGAELAAILCARDRGVVYFFAMSTSFTRAALGAEGVGKDVDLMIGNGYARGHAEHTLDLLRSNAKLRALFERRYG